jgi:hypothetical protein
VLGVLAWAGVLLARQWSQPAPPQAAEASPPPARESLQFRRHLNQGHLWNAKKEYALAAGAFGQAEALAPPERKEEIGRLRQSAQVAAATLQDLDSRRAEIEQNLADGELALTQGNRDEAVRLAEAVLVLEAGNERAMDLRRRGARASSRTRTTSAPQPATRTEPEPVAAATPEPAPIPDPSQSRESALVIDFRSNFPGDVSVIVRIDRAERFRRDVSRRGGIFRREEGPLAFTERLPLVTDDYEINVQVTPSRRKAHVLTRKANFPGGGSRTVVIRVAENGTVSAVLN